MVPLEYDKLSFFFLLYYLLLTIDKKQKEKKKKAGRERPFIDAIT